MNLESLKVFCSIADRQSVSLGAAENHLTQSAATQCLHRLEQEMGARLIDRCKRPLVLTAEGKLCYDRFRQLLGLWEDLQGELRSLSGEVSGCVRVAAIYSIGLHSLGAPMRKFMSAHPKALVRLQYAPPDQVYQAVKDAAVDLGIVSYPKPQPGLAVIPLESERMVLACQPGHPLCGHDAVPLARLRGETFIGFDRELPIRKELDRQLRQHGVAVRVAMSFDNIETIKHAVEIGEGVSILPEATVSKEVQAGVLATVELLGCDLRRPVGVLHLERKIFTPAMSRFLELLKQSSVEAMADVG